MNSVLITGATSGIGKQLAQDYADAGAKVIACGRNRQVLQELEDYSPITSKREKHYRCCPLFQTCGYLTLVIVSTWTMASLMPN